jgi:hypothetical protein
MQNDLPRKTIDELVCFYELEPSVRDIYVEGESDKCLLEWCLGTELPENGGLVLIGDVDIDDKSMPEDFDRGNRDRVIFLIGELNKAVQFKNYLGVIDRDFLRFTRGEPSIPNLVLTDFGCAELFLLNSDCLGKMNKLAFTGKVADIENLLDFINTGMTHLSAVCVLEKRKNVSLQKLNDIARYLSCTKKVVTFHSDKYFSAILDRNNLKSRESELYNSFKAIVTELSASEPRTFGNGHHFMQLVHHYLVKLKIMSRQVPLEATEAVIRSSMELADLKSSSIYAKISSFLKPASA